MDTRICIGSYSTLTVALRRLDFTLYCMSCEIHRQLGNTQIKYFMNNNNIIYNSHWFNKSKK